MVASIEPDAGRSALLVECAHETSEERRHLAAAFRGWAGPEADLRVLFTPDVLIAVDTTTSRGHLYDDGWTLTCCIEVGEKAFVARLQMELSELDDHFLLRTPDDPDVFHALTTMARAKGSPIDEVRHLI